MADVKIKIAAQDDASRVLAGVRGSLDSVASTAASLGSSLGLLGAVSVGSFVALARSAINSLDALNDLKDATGSSIENLSALEDVAARTGTSFETVGSALVKFNGALKAAKPGDDVSASFKALGLNLAELKNLDPAEALQKTAIALSSFADDGNKARVVQELFGKSIKDVAPLLKDLAEKGQLVATVTTAQAQAAEDFNKQIFNLQKNTTDLSRSLVSSLLPTLIRLSDEFISLSKNSTGFFDAIAISFRIGFKDSKSAIADLNEELDFLNKHLTTDSPINKQYRQQQIDFVERTKKMVQEVQALNAIATSTQSEAETKRLGRNAPQVSAKTSIGDVGGNKDAQAAANTELKKQQDLLFTLSGLNADYYEQLNRLMVMRKRGNIDEEQYNRLLDDLVKKQPGVSKALAENEKALQAQTKANEQAQEAYQKYIDGLVKEQDALAKSNESLRQNVEEIGLTKEAVTALQVARIDASIAQEQEILNQAKANEANQAEILILERKIELLKEQRGLTAQGGIKQAAADTKADQDKASKEYAQTLKNDLKGAFSAAFRDSKDPLKAFGEALENVMFTRASTALAEALANAAIEKLGSSAAGEGIGNFIASLFSFDGGGHTGNAPRTGGVDGKGGFLSILHPQESVFDHTKGQSMGSGGGDVNVTQHIRIDSRSDQATIFAAMNSAKEAAKSEILRSRSRGGAFA
jgi:hypothetical protein